ncbi:RNA-directed DNA polymerase from mobile element jockey [Nephila pilipes]|uniref:RNA-directed DNA polymerase from mobile element jockey n=1 Tax=Nephila pilipes TaxID=299642 RepID=A0A8X6R4Q1_NEPPI|nr:RNA-directed DNA polymerase from mobile element jockey [Nephila pilipes]
MLIYALILRPILTYASPVWAHCTPTTMDILESSQSSILRTIVKAHWYMRTADIRNSLNFPTLKQFIKKIAKNFYNKIDISTNRTIQTIEKYTPINNNQLLHTPREILLD